MSKVSITTSKLDALANAISLKSGETVPLTLDEMVQAVDGIETGGGGTPTLQAKPYTVDSAGTETITADNGYDGLSEVEVTVPSATLANNTQNGFYTDSGVRKWHYRAVCSTLEEDTGAPGWLGEGEFPSSWVNYRVVPSGTTITPTTSSQTIGGANYMMEGAVTVAAMPSGTAGTPTATKGTVSNHSMTVTPSVTNQTGYIEGSTKTGTAVSVSASELVSGNLPITQNGNNIDVTNYATVSVDVSGSSGMTVGTATATPATASSSISFTGLQGEPTSFYVVSAANLATGASPYKTASVVFDGTNVIGQYITNTSNAQMTYSSSAFSKSYSNGTLTITGTASNFQANQYKLVYTYGGNSANIGTKSVQVGSGATSITFTGLSDEPTCFACIFTDNIGTSSGYTRAHIVLFDGSSIYGMEMGSGSSATSNWTKSYSSGSLTITSTSTSAGGYFHQPGYYELAYGIGGEINIEIESLTVTQNGTYSESGKAYSPVIVNVSGSGSASIGTKTTTNSSATNTSISFTQLSGTPKAFFVRLTTQVARNSSNRYYYVATMRWDGSSTGGVAGNKFYQYNGTYSNQTSGYSYSYSNNTLTLTSTGSQSSSPGSFYNGDYELIYVY